MKNEPAFPVPENHEWTGITIRDYFAAQAIHGWMQGNRAYPEYDAEDAYKLADAMLKAREAA